MTRSAPAILAQPTKSNFLQKKKNYVKTELPRLKPQYTIISLIQLITNAKKILRRTMMMMIKSSTPMTEPMIMAVPLSLSSSPP